MGRYILHSDLNNFYASVESLFDVSVRSKPLVVVGDQEKRHGIVLAKNYIAKDYGVKTGDTVWEAKQKCGQDLVCKTARLDLYLKIGKMVKDIYREYSSRVESFGVDEAWIDVSNIASSYEEAVNIANNIRCRIIAEIGLTVSVGVSFNKVFAKLGSDLKKPNATVLITEDNYQSLVWDLPAGDLLYVGRATAKKFEKAGIVTIGDLARTDKKYLSLLLGKVGIMLWNFANGYDNSPVEFYDDDGVIKSFGNSTTCPVDLTTNEQVKSVIYVLAENVASRMRKGGYYGRCITLWVKNNELESVDKQGRVENPTNISSDIASKAYQLFLECYDWNRDVRAVGVRVTSLCNSDIQYDLFGNVDKSFKIEKLENMIENLRKRYGYNIIRRGNILEYSSLTSINPEKENHIIHPIGFLKGKKL